MRTWVKALCLLLLAVGALAMPAAADVLLDCDFEDQPLDQIIGTGGAEAHQPVDLGGIDAYVRTSPTGGRALEIVDTVDFGALALRFEFLEQDEVTSGWLTLRALLYFEVDEEYNVYVREAMGAAQSFMDLRFEQGGTVSHGDKDNFGMFPVGNYTTGEDLLLEIVFDMAAATCAVWLDGTLIVPAESHGVTETGIGSILIGFDHDSDLDGRFYLQSVSAEWAATPTAARSLGAIKSLW